MSESQFCPECPTDMPKYRESGRWVEVEGHEHRLPRTRPNVYLYDDTPGAHQWRAHLDIWADNGWLGSQTFSTQEKALDYAAQVLYPLAEARYKSQQTSKNTHHDGNYMTSSAWANKDQYDEELK